MKIRPFTISFRIYYFIRINLLIGGSFFLSYIFINNNTLPQLWKLAFNSDPLHRYFYLFIILSIPIYLLHLLLLIVITYIRHFLYNFPFFDHIWEHILKNDISNYFHCIYSYPSMLARLFLRATWESSSVERRVHTRLQIIFHWSVSKILHIFIFLLYHFVIILFWRFIYQYFLPI